VFLVVSRAKMANLQMTGILEKVWFLFYQGFQLMNCVLVGDGVGDFL
jgi:hypothetical protein